MCQSTNNTAAASSVQALIDATRLLVDKMDRKGYLSEPQLANYDKLIADAEATAKMLAADTVLYAVVLSDSGVETIMFNTEDERREFFSKQDDCGDDFYELDITQDRNVEMGLAQVGVAS